MRQKGNFILLITISVIFCVCSPLAAQNLLLPRYLVLEQNNLKNCCLPAVPKLNSISEDKANQFFHLLIKEGIEYRDVNRSCEDRAQYINLMLRKNGITSAKVWIIAPARYTLLSRELIKVNDPFGVFGQVTWGYHVAPIIQVRRGAKTELLVIDQLFSPSSGAPLGTPFIFAHLRKRDVPTGRSTGLKPPVFSQAVEQMINKIKML
ncbi:MAG: hypothetical protein CXR30_19365, partial [Geobacter sp.]